MNLTNLKHSILTYIVFSEQVTLTIYAYPYFEWYIFPCAKGKNSRSNVTDVLSVALLRLISLTIHIP
jgi:hypothetical protein